MKLFLASIATLLFMCVQANAQMFSKPVSCGAIEELIPLFEEDGMYPLIGLGGVSPTGTPGDYKPSVSVLVINEEGKWSLFEKSGSQFCLLSGGFVIEYNSDKIKTIMDWD